MYVISIIVLLQSGGTNEMDQVERGSLKRMFLCSVVNVVSPPNIEYNSSCCVKCWKGDWL